MASQQPWFDKLATVVIADPRPYYYERLILADSIRNLRIFLYQDNEAGVVANMNKIYSIKPANLTTVINQFIFDDFDANWFASFSERIRFIVLNYFVSGNFIHLNDATLQYQLLEQFFGGSKPNNPEIIVSAQRNHLLRFLF